MNNPSDGNEKQSGSLLQWIFRRRLPLERETSLFIIVSALDVIMTWILLRREGFVESNPIASYFLHGWGIKGMVYFKFALVAFITVLCQIIALKKEDVARRILQFATVLVACVVLYSFSLLLRFAGPPPVQ